MAIKPILFNADMVRAILDGSKTVTRRVVKPQPPEIVNLQNLNGRLICSFFADCDICCEIKAPYQIGDILYVRETWQEKRGGGYLYKADTENSFDLFVTPDGRVVNEIPWRPSIHMQKEAARIFLRVKDVGMERLQDMDGVMAVDEGFTSENSWDDVIRLWNSTINKNGLPIYGWSANPWVWVIRFERCAKPEGW